MLSQMEAIQNGKEATKAKFNPIQISVCEHKNPKSSR